MGSYTAEITSSLAISEGRRLAETTPPATPATTSSVSALPSWLVVAMLALVACIIAAMFILTFYNLSAPRSTLKNFAGRRRQQGRSVERAQDSSHSRPLHALMDDPVLRPSVVEALSMAARVGKRTTRTTLAIAGFALLGVVLIAVFGASGDGVRDIRSQVVTAVITLVAAIAGFYFGSESSSRNPSPVLTRAGSGDGSDTNGEGGAGNNASIPRPHPKPNPSPAPAPQPEPEPEPEPGPKPEPDPKPEPAPEPDVLARLLARLLATMPEEDRIGGRS